jgi:YesN/AraC family two-component response regulator
MRERRDSKSGRQIIRQVRTYIGEQYGNPDLSLSLIGDTFGLQPSHLSKLFKEEFGVKFIDYVTGVRMEKAKELLEKTSWPIQEIASAVGYANAITFNRVFKKETGNTPGNYRRDLA